MVAVLAGSPAHASVRPAAFDQLPAAQPPVAQPPPIPQLAPKPKEKKAKAPEPAPPKFPSTAKWSATIDAAPIAPPVVAGGRVLLALRSGVLTARAVADGAELWTAKLPIDQPIAADDGRVFVVTGERLHALSGEAGTPLWEAPIGQPSAPIVARGGWVIAASGGAVTAIRAADGERVWSKATGAVSERPAIDGDVLYLPLAEGRLAALDLKTGTERWSQEVGPSPTEPLVYASRVYLGSEWKRFLCLDAADGEELWNHNLGTRIIGPAAADASRVYFTAMDNQLRALSRDNGGRRWLFPLAYRPTRGPVILGAQVAVPGITNELPGVNVATGKASGKLTLSMQLAIGPAFVVPAGADGVPAVVAITGGQTNQWTLSLAVPAPDPPAAAAPPK
jgi:outer membrane protein assembly factor BamB